MGRKLNTECHYLSFPPSSVHFAYICQYIYIYNYDRPLPNQLNPLQNKAMLFSSFPIILVLHNFLFIGLEIELAS